MAKITLLEAARYYTRLGLAVLPLTEGGSAPHAELLKGGSDGAERATWDPCWITKWWSEKPRANIGIATGRSKSNIIAVCAPDEHALAGRDFGNAPHILTPGGAHIHCFKIPKGQDFAHGEWGGLYIAADGGYIVAPPSMSGWKFFARVGGNWEDIPLAPTWLTDWEVARHAEKVAAEEATEEEGGNE